VRISPPNRYERVPLRSIDADQEAVFFGLYAAVRAEELAMRDWDAQLRDQILHLQFEASATRYLAQFPNACERLILRKGVAVGWVIADDEGVALRCVDIAVVRTSDAAVSARTCASLQEERPRTVAAVCCKCCARIFRRARSTIDSDSKSSTIPSCNTTWSGGHDRPGDFSGTADTASLST